jgi:3',5'-cyclic AMP phosphodiesterase CpdA
MHRLFATLAGVVALIAAGTAAPQLPGRTDSVRFAVIGDNGNGSKAQYDVGAQMAAARARVAFDFVVMLGDNMYGSQKPADFVDKFERPYAALLEARLPFYAALGNHDDPSNRSYPGFNMSGRRYYTYVKDFVRFFVLDTNLLDPQQLAWFEQALQQSPEEWQIAYFHHPLYSNARRHGSDVELRVVLEPLLVRHGVDVVFSGHEHIYERIKPQKGITYFTEGSSGQLRKGDVAPAPSTAAWFDQDQTFMLVEVTRDRLYFETVSRTGRVVDSGAIAPRPKDEAQR